MTLPIVGLDEIDKRLTVEGDDPQFRCGVEYIRRWLSTRDVRRLKHLVLRHGSKLDQRVEGSRTFSITIDIGSETHRIFYVPLPPLYRQPDGTWRPASSAVGAARFPDGIIDGLSLLQRTGCSPAVCRRWIAANATKPGGARLAHISTLSDGQEVATLIREVTLTDPGDRLVYSTFWNLYDWLRRTHQIAGHRDYADQARVSRHQLAAFRRTKSRTRRAEQEADNEARRVVRHKAARIRRAFPSGRPRGSGFPGENP